MSITIKNLEAAFAGESQAHVKYRYFAKMARAQGHEEVAKHFEHTADHPGIPLCGGRMAFSNLTTKDQVREFIEGFN